MGRSSVIKDHLNYKFNRSEKIKEVNLMEFILENNIEKIDVLKIDIEGSELKALSSIKNFLINIGIIYIEIHELKNIEKIYNLLLTTHTEIEVKIHNKNLRESIFINKNYKNLI